MREAFQIESKFKANFNENRRRISATLKNTSNNILNEIFYPHSGKLTKKEFRRLVELRVKKFVGSSYVDFDNIGQLQLFDKLKKTIYNDPLIKERKTNIKLDENTLSKADRIDPNKISRRIKLIGKRKVKRAYRSLGSDLTAIEIENNQFEDDCNDSNSTRKIINLIAAYVRL